MAIQITPDGDDGVLIRFNSAAQRLLVAQTLHDAFGQEGENLLQCFARIIMANMRRQFQKAKETNIAQAAREQATQEVENEFGGAE